MKNPRLGARRRTVVGQRLGCPPHGATHCPTLHITPAGGPQQVCEWPSVMCSDRDQDTHNLPRVMALPAIYFH